MAGGETLSEYAARRGVSENAARFLMKGVLRKTDSRDQARLVARLRGLPANTAVH
jgi:DNA-binding CsgD family transcriptional regulator